MPSPHGFIFAIALVARRHFRSLASGQGLAEYALILGLIAMVAIVALLFLGQNISETVLEHFGGTIQSSVN